MGVLVDKSAAKALKNAVDPTTGSFPTIGTIISGNKMTTQAASTASDVPTIVSDFNALLAKLKVSGLMS